MAITLPTGPLAKPLSQRVLKKAARRVCFDESSNVEHKNIDWSFDECKNTWYSKLDYKRMKDNSHQLAKKIWKKERSLKSEDSYQSTVLRVYDSCCEAQRETDDCILSQNDEAILAQLVGKTNTRSGLEKVFIREIAHDKRYRRQQLSQLVRRVQASSMAGSTHSKAELLRLSSESISRTSRLFARHMAQALKTSLN